MSRPSPGPGRQPDAEPTIPPPRAFTQGVGLVFQFAGVTLFLGLSLVCCITALLPREMALWPAGTEIGWHLPGDLPGAPSYHAARAMSVIVFGGVLFGLALSGLGLGMQAQYRGAPVTAAATALIGSIFWITHAIFALGPMRSVLVGVLCIVLALVFALLLALSAAAAREMALNPPPPDHEVLPRDYKVPYSHLHQDPPEVRLARELEQRRQRLAVEQKELELMEQRLKRRLDEKDREQR